MSAINQFDLPTMRRILEAVRIVESMTTGGRPPNLRRTIGENEVFVTGTADGDCDKDDNDCECTPDIPGSADNLTYDNVFADVKNGEPIVIRWEQREQKQMLRENFQIVAVVVNEEIGPGDSGDVTANGRTYTAQNNYDHSTCPNGARGYAAKTTDGLALLVWECAE